MDNNSAPEPEKKKELKVYTFTRNSILKKIMKKPQEKIN